MAQTTNRSLTRQASRVFGILGVLLLIEKSCAHDYMVGSSQGWTVPHENLKDIYNQWAENNRFQIGDRLLFVYATAKDSVLQVTKDQYKACNTSAPLYKYTDGHTTIQFNQSGPHYFISGVADNCQKNEKLVVVVLADRTKHNSSNGTLGATPSPSPSPKMPSSSAPAGEESPPPPPSLAPSEESTPPNNGAYSTGFSVVGAIVAGFVGSSLVLGI